MPLLQSERLPDTCVRGTGACSGASYNTSALFSTVLYETEHLAPQKTLHQWLKDLHQDSLILTSCVFGLTAGKHLSLALVSHTWFTCKLLNCRNFDSFSNSSAVSAPTFFSPSSRFLVYLQICNCLSLSASHVCPLRSSLRSVCLGIAFECHFGVILNCTTAERSSAWCTVSHHPLYAP